MGKRTLTRIALLGAVSLPILPALAQEIDALRMTLGVDQRFEFGDNLGLDTPAEGNSSISTTRLSFGLISETDRQQLSLGLSGGLTIQDTPDTDGTQTDWGTPRLRFSYRLSGDNANLRVNANYTVAFIDTLELSDFVNDEGIVELPEDFSGLSGEGQRTSYSASAFLELGTDAPLGFDLSAGISGVSYSGPVDPDLFDFDRTFVGARALLRISPVLRGTAGLRYSTYDADDDEQTYRTRTTANLGFDYRVSPRATFEASVGVTEIDTQKIGEPDTDTSSPVGNLGFAYEMPNGQITADLDASADDGGDERINFVVGRSLELPDGSLSATLGFTDPQEGPAAPIGSLSWLREMRNGQLTAQINRSVSSNNEDETNLTTLVVLGYNQDLNDRSGFGLNVNYGLSDATDTTNQVTRAGISASYRYALTEDWDLNTGVNYRTRQEQGEDRASSPSIFLSIGRNFEFRP